MSAKIDRCGSCGAAIYWLKNQNTGKPAPIDAVPAPASEGVKAANISVDLTAESYSVISEAARWPYLGMLHRNHFMTCPQSKSWAKRGGRNDTRTRRGEL